MERNCQLNRQQSPPEDKTYFKSKYQSCVTRGGKKGSTNTFVAFIERGVGMLRPGGVLSLIVPMSVISSEQCEQLHAFLGQACVSTTFASFADRPRQVFDNASVNVTILESVIAKVGGGRSKFLSTALMRHREGVELVELLSTLSFTDSSAFYMKGRFPKVGKDWELQLLEHLWSLPSRISDLVASGDDFDEVYYRTAGGRYFKVVTTKATGSSAEKMLKVKRGYGPFVAAVLSSSLFFWWYQLYSDNLNLKQAEILNFPLTVAVLSDSRIDEIGRRYSNYAVSIEEISKLDGLLTTLMSTVLTTTE